MFEEKKTKVYPETLCLRLLIKSNLSLYLLYFAEACIGFAEPISASLRPSNTASFELMSQGWRTFGNTVFDLIGRRFESQTSRSRDERVTARPTGWSKLLIIDLIAPLRPWIPVLFVAYRFFFSAWIVLNKSLLIYKNYQYFTGASVFDLRNQAQTVTFLLTSVATTIGTGRK